MTARVTTKYPELVLQRNHLIVARIQELGGRLIVFQPLFTNLAADESRIIIVAPLIVHRDDDGVRCRRGSRDGQPQVIGERGNPAATRQRIADERDAAWRAQMDFLFEWQRVLPVRPP